MDKGVKFVLENIERTLNLINENEEYKHLKSKVLKEYYYIKAIKKTGNAYEHFLKFSNYDHKYAEKFSFLKEYGIIPNEEMAEYLRNNYVEELGNNITINDLKLNKIYSNNEIRVVFGCSDRGGMRPSKKHNALVLIVKHDNALYDDNWNDENILFYTGEGQKGNQKIDKRNNATLANSNTNGVKIYLFESYEENKYYFRGQVCLAGQVGTTKEIDVDGKLRTVLKFPLKRIENSIEILIPEKEQKNVEHAKEKYVNSLSKEQLKRAAKNVKSKSNSKNVVTKYYERNPIVSKYTKQRARGLCDLCKQPAPFNGKDDIPFLESHHVITRAKGGPDVIYNTVALCPNCHRKIHVLEDENDIHTLVEVLRKYVEEDADETILKKFNKLFKR